MLISVSLLIVLLSCCQGFVQQSQYQSQYYYQYQSHLNHYYWHLPRDASSLRQRLRHSRHPKQQFSPYSRKISLLQRQEKINNNDYDDNDEEKKYNTIESTNDISCVKGVCATTITTETKAEAIEDSGIMERILSSYIGPRIILAAVACIYGTNFPLGSLMNDALPASAATCARMVLATLVLAPQLLQLDPTLRQRAVLCGCFTSLGYISQSLALVDTSPATVSFLGTAVVVWCPLLEWLVDKKPSSLQDAPQTWLAALLCLMGVGMLELAGESGATSVGIGDVLALLQAVGFGTGIFLSEKMMRSQPTQALPVTATLVATTAFFSMLWCFTDGWMQQPGWETMTLPNLFFEPSLTQVAAAVAWTGIVSTSLNFFIEITALGRVPSAEASVLLATEPLWAAVFASAILHETFGINDFVGGALIVMACLANTLKPTDFYKVKDTSG